MDNLEPELGFYERNKYGEYEKRFLHYATVSLFYVLTYNNDLILLIKFYLYFFLNIKNIFIQNFSF